MSEDTNINELGEVSAAPMVGEAPTPEAPGNSLELTVNDLQLIRQTIEVATSRGAFKANEMLTVGTVFNKLEKFLTAVAQEQQKQGETNGS